MAKQSGKLGLKMTYDVDSMAVVVAVHDYDADKSLESETFDYSDLAPSTEPRVKLYGLGKILADRNSQVKDDPAKKLAGMKEVFDLLCSGEWKAERAGGGLGVVSVDVEALAAVKGITIPEAQRALKEYSKEQREKILSSSRVQAEAAKIKKAREASAPESLDDLIG